MSTQSAEHYWDRHAKNYDRSMRVLGKPMKRVCALTGEAVRGADVVLELAAGTGLITSVLASEANHVFATDYAAAMVSMLEARMSEMKVSNVKCERADVYALRFEPDAFDAVVAANVLHLLPDVEGAISAMRRVLKPSGRLIVPTFCHDETLLSAAVSRLLALTRFPAHRRFTARSLIQALEQNGLRVTRQELVPGVIPIQYIEGVFPS